MLTGRSDQLDNGPSLFSIAFSDAWDWSAFYDEAGNYTPNSLEQVLRDHRPDDRTWAAIPNALERLAGWYKHGEEEMFARDVGTLFGGLKDRFSEPDALRADTFPKPAHIWVYVNAGDMPAYMIGVDLDANIHH
jgi:hypothetical protein